MDQYSTMYQQHDYIPNRSPSSTRGYNTPSTLNRQPSRHFQPHYESGLQQPLYTSENIPQPRYDTEPRYDGRLPPTSIPNHYAYDSQTWGYGTAGSQANTMVGTGRMTGQNRTRRAPLPSVSDPFHSLRDIGLSSYLMPQPMRQYHPSHDAVQT
jgi:hypothetical protein